MICLIPCSCIKGRSLWASSFVESALCPTTNKASAEHIQFHGMPPGRIIFVGLPICQLGAQDDSGRITLLPQLNRMEQPFMFRVITIQNHKGIDLCQGIGYNKKLSKGTQIQ